MFAFIKYYFSEFFSLRALTSGPYIPSSEYMIVLFIAFILVVFSTIIIKLYYHLLLRKILTSYNQSDEKICHIELSSFDDSNIVIPTGYSLLMRFMVDTFYQYYFDKKEPYTWYKPASVNKFHHIVLVSAVIAFCLSCAVFFVYFFREMIVFVLNIFV